MQFSRNGRDQVANIKPSGEVILCAGVFGSPQILELSGIGRNDVLTSAKIALVHELPGVGENLQDHLNCSCSVELKDEVETRDIESHDPAVYKIVADQYAKDKTGPFKDGWVHTFAHVPSQWLAPQSEQEQLQDTIDTFLKDDDKVPQGTRLQYEFIKSAVENPDEATITMFMIDRQRHPDLYSLPANTPRTVPGKFVSLVAMLSYPFSRGSCHIVSHDASARPQIKFNYLTHSLDRILYRSHLRQLDRFCELAPFSELIKPDGVRLPRTNSGKFTDIADAELDEIMKKTVATNYHPCGTCAMMAETVGGVVDETFKVYGTSNLRIVDASVMPIIPRGNILTTVYALAGKAADVMLNELQS